LIFCSPGIGTVTVNLGKEDHELIPGITADDVLSPDAGLEDLGDLLDGAVSGEVTVGVIDFLEVVDVHHDKSEAAVRLSRPLHRLGKALFQESAVVQPRKLVPMYLILFLFFFNLFHNLILFLEKMPFK
jgi:hypothetical protein